jgi:hypothetical protein
VIARAIVALLLASISACGPKPQPAPNPKPDPKPAPKPTPDPAMVEVLDALRTHRDRMCACADEACVEKVEAEQFEWGFDHKALVDRSKPTPAQQQEASVLIEATEHCAHALRPSS